MKILQDNINTHMHEHFWCLSTSARELAMAVQNDQELNNLFSCVTIDQRGMLSNIYVLLS